jgi:alpha/beta superfamily hydrolase
MPMKGKEEAVVIESSGLRLEGRLAGGRQGLRPALLCAPHPLYGGNMDNEVIAEAARALSEMGHAVLRFNYRGAGRSEGSYAGGMGESRDAGAAVDFLRMRTGSPVVMICGYSFGAWVALQCATGRRDVGPLVLISPPNRMMDFDLSVLPPGIILLAGTEDELCDAALLSLQFGKDIRLVEGADHFYSTGLDELMGHLRALAVSLQREG